MVVLTLSIGGGGGGGGGLELSYEAHVYLPLFALLVSQLLSRGFGTYLSSHSKVFVASVINVIIPSRALLVTVHSSSEVRSLQ